MSVPVVDDRFVLDPVPPQVGGTAHVHLATDYKNGGAKVAIKLYDGTAIDDDLRQECYRRESAALSAFTHPNVVRLISSGFDEDRQQHYLALEWLESNLKADLEGDGEEAFTWAALSRRVFLPLLEGLGAAHARHLIHRDIKPPNIMVDAAGTVKLTDFGISKLLDSFRQHMTVHGLHSPPYAAPEHSTGHTDGRSDLYSLGVTMIELLEGADSKMSSDSDPTKLLEALSIPDDATHFLRWLVSKDPEGRPRTAKLALVELKRLLVWHPEKQSTRRPELRLMLTRRLIEQAQGLLGAEEGEARSALIEDLSDKREAPTLAPDRRWQGDWKDESAIRLDLCGRELQFHGHFDKEETGSLVLLGVRYLPSTVLERRREESLELGHKLVFEGRAPHQRDDADALIEMLADRAAAKAAADYEQTENALFERWRSVLDAKTDLEARREEPLVFDGWTEDHGVVTFTVRHEVDERYLDQARRAPLPGGRAVVGTVVEVGDEEIGLVVESGSLENLPSKGQLLIDRVASRRAIERQREALNTIREKAGAREDLAELLVHPDRAGSTADRSVTSFFQELDGPKRKAINVALSSPDFTLVQGPPGTGKTTFITELIAQVVAGTPDARVLLSSQTHVAVDNAAVKLGDLTDVRVVRVGAEDKVDPAASHLTVGRRLRAWHLEATEKSAAWLEQWGQGRGVSAGSLKAYGAMAELSVANQNISRIKGRLRELTAEEFRLLEILTDPARPTASSANTGGLVVDGEDELAALQDDTEARQKELNNLEADRARQTTILCGLLDLEQLPKEQDAVESLVDGRFAVADIDLEQYQGLARLRDEWLVRFGQGEDFTEALLSDAQVVAGTCVGLAGSLDEQSPFDLVIVDEVSKATPTEALVPMAVSRRWVLVGDEQQLPPYADTELVDEGLLESYGLARKDLEETMFSQLDPGLPEDRRLVLSEQHRMLPAIGKLVSHCFYDDKLASARSGPSSFKSLGEVFPAAVTWYSTARASGRRESRTGTTFWNEAELRVIRGLLNELQAAASKEDESLEVAVISGYGEQARRLQRDLRPNDSKWSHLDLHVHPVDSFQGQERDVVIYSVTRSNKEGQLGFLRSERRINVALSRAKDALVIVGDDRFCARAGGGQSALARVINHIRDRSDCELRSPK